MTWDTQQPRNPAKSGPSQNWDGPSWWDEPSRPQTGAGAAAAATLPVRKTASAQTLEGTRNGGNGNGKGNGAAKIELAEAKRVKAKTRSRTSTRNGLAMDWGVASLVLGFGLGVIGAFFLATVVVYGYSRTFDGKIMPGVHSGSVDLSGLTRAEAIAKLEDAYANLSDGTVTLSTPAGTSTISFKDANRAVDAAAMADAAMDIGRGGNPVTSTALAIRAMTGGADVPVLVKIDPTALEQKLRELTASSMQPPVDASVANNGGTYTVVPSTVGRGIDEKAIALQLIAELSSPDAPGDLTVDGKFINLQPHVTEQQAQAAIDSASKMNVDLTLTDNDKTWKVEAKTVYSWVVFGIRTDGSYGPVVDPNQISTYLTTLAKQVTVPPVEPTVIYTAGKPTGLIAGKNGETLNIGATAQAIEAYLDGLAMGTSNGGNSLAIVVDTTPPTITDPSLKGFVMISNVITTYYPGESNGNGVNIALPAKLINGQVVGAGQHFDFLKAVGPIDAAHGWKLGGVIKGGLSYHTGAMGGGICSASTTTFQSVAVAGLQIDERHAHEYWIDRYTLDGTVGLDATVFSNGTTTYDLRWTNDTDNPIVIKAWTSGSSRVAAIHVQLWSLPLNRHVTFSGGVKANVVKASDTAVYVPSLPAGQKTYRKEYPTAGFDTSVTRTVTDSTGAVIHSDTWSSHYVKVDGVLQIAGTPHPSGWTPSPKPTKTPATPPPATPTPVASARLREDEELDEE